MKITKVGMRTIKTVISVILTLTLGELFQLRSPLLASLGAIMTMESSISESFQAGKYRVYGTVLGGLVALAIVSLAPYNYFFLGLGLIAIINICNTLRWERAARMGMVVFLIIILDYRDGDGLYYIFNRTLDTSIGIIIGTATNFFLRPPDIEKKIMKTLNSMYRSTKKSLEELIWKNEFEDLDELKDEIISVNEDYKVLTDDLKFHIGKSINGNLYLDLFDSFDKIQNHFTVIQDIKERPKIDQENKEIIEDFFKKEMPTSNNKELDKLDFIYNYHLKRILIKLINIDKIINKAHNP